MPDYSSGKIYMVYPKVDNVDEGDVYYGSTIDTLARRMVNHRSSNKCSSKILFDKYGVENCFIELVEEYPCETKQQLNRKEGEYIRNHKCVNKAIAGRTFKEYRTENRDKLLEKQKQYDIKNRDKIKEYKKEYYIDNRDKIKEYTKEYRTENVDKHKETTKKYYIDNRDNILERQKQKVTCPICNKELSKAYIKPHIKTQHK